MAVARWLQNRPLLLGSKRSDQGEDLIALCASYESLPATMAGKDLLAQIVQIRAALEQDLLLGRTDAQGNDLTPYLRPAYSLLTDLLAIPSQLEYQRELLEAELGVGQAHVDKE